jgi:hypothetical protein
MWLPNLQRLGRSDLDVALRTARREEFVRGALVAAVR